MLHILANQQLFTHQKRLSIRGRQFVFEVYYDGINNISRASLRPYVCIPEDITAVALSPNIDFNMIFEMVNVGFYNYDSICRMLTSVRSQCIRQLKELSHMAMRKSTIITVFVRE